MEGCSSRLSCSSAKQSTCSTSILARPSSSRCVLASKVIKVEETSDEVAVMGEQGLSTAMENASRGMSGQREVTGGEGIGYRQIGRVGMGT